MRYVTTRATGEPTGGPADIFKSLTSQEYTSLRYMVDGMTNKVIAHRMSLQEVTVKMHLRNAYRKLGAANRVAAVRIAVEAGLAKRSDGEATE